MSWNAVLKWKEDLMLSKENITLVRCLETQFWNEKKIYCSRKKHCDRTMFWNAVLKWKEKFIVVEKKHHVRTMSWNAILRWKKDLLSSKKNITLVRCLETQFWNEKKIYYCRKKHCDRTMSWNAVLRWKKEFIVVERNNAIIRCLEMQFWNEKKDLLLSKKIMRSYDVLKCNSEMKKKISCCRKKTSRLYDVLRRNSEMKKKIYCCRKKHYDCTMSWNAVLKWKKKFTVVEKNNAIVRCLKMQFWNEKKNLLLLKKTLRSYDVLKYNSEMKKRIYYCRKKQCDHTMSWNAVLKWKKEFIVVKKNNAIVRCFKMQFWNEKKIYCCQKKTSRSYDVLKRSSKMKKKIYCCRKKHCDRTISWNAILKWKEEFIVVERNNAIVRCLETQFWDEKKIYCCRKKTSRSYKILKRTFEMNNIIDINKIYCCRKKTSRSYEILR
jgi:uncharacterized pyridoxamine 5'-phosphate oxidase family protein